MNHVPDAGFRDVVAKIVTTREKEQPGPPMKGSGPLIVTLENGARMSWESYWRRFVATVIDRN